MKRRSRHSFGSCTRPTRNRATCRRGRCNAPYPYPPSELHWQLAHFTGTEAYHRTHPGLLATDGAKYLADAAGAYWLLDIIWSVLPKITDEFAVLELTVAENRRAAVHIHDGREPETTYHRQEIAWTDFPLASIKLYIQENGTEHVVMLPSEY